MQERLYEMYKTFFDKAEQERRWNPLRDIPYDKINAGTFRSRSSLVRGDVLFGRKLSSGLRLAGNQHRKRPYFGQAWFSANWAYEESKHSVALMEYMLQSGRRSSGAHVRSADAA